MLLVMLHFNEICSLHVEDEDLQSHKRWMASSGGSNRWIATLIRLDGIKILSTYANEKNRQKPKNPGIRSVCHEKGEEEEIEAKLICVKLNFRFFFFFPFRNVLGEKVWKYFFSGECSFELMRVHIAHTYLGCCCCVVCTVRFFFRKEKLSVDTSFPGEFSVLKVEAWSDESANFTRRWGIPKSKWRNWLTKLKILG